MAECFPSFLHVGKRNKVRDLGELVPHRADGGMLMRLVGCLRRHPFENLEQRPIRPRAQQQRRFGGDEMCFAERAPMLADQFAQCALLALLGAIGGDDRFGSFAHKL